MKQKTPAVRAVMTHGSARRLLQRLLTFAGPGKEIPNRASETGQYMHTKKIKFLENRKALYGGKVRGRLEWTTPEQSATENTTSAPRFQDCSPTEQAVPEMTYSKTLSAMSDEEMHAAVMAIFHTSEPFRRSREQNSALLLSW